MSDTDKLSPDDVCDAVHLLVAYAETCRHIEELERIQASSKHTVCTGEAKKRAALLIERMLELTPTSKKEFEENK